jgi:hypothetical protein
MIGACPPVTVQLQSYSAVPVPLLLKYCTIRRQQVHSRPSRTAKLGQHIIISYKNVGYALVKSELQAITYPARFPGGVGAKVLGSTGQEAQ